MHVNSLLAYYQNQKTFNQREMMILGWLLMNPGEWSVRQIKSGMGFEDMNAVAPRVCHLIEMKALEERGSVKCPMTGIDVRTVAVSELFLSRQIERPRKDLVHAGGDRGGRCERWKVPVRGQCSLF